MIMLLLLLLALLLQQDQYFPMLCPHYAEVVHCLLSYATNAEGLVAIAAIDHVAELGAHLARGRVPLDDDAPTLPRTLWKQRYGGAGYAGASAFATREALIESTI